MKQRPSLTRSENFPKKLKQPWTDQDKQNQEDMRKLRMVKLNISKEAFAKMFNLSPWQFAHYERGTVRWPQRYVDRIKASLVNEK